MIGLVVPVLVNFEGFTRLMASIDLPVKPYVVPNYDGNIGVSAGWNQGIAQAIEDDCTHCFVMNDDIILAKGTLRRMWSVLDSHSNCLMATAINTRDFPVDHEVTETPDFSCFVISPRYFIDQIGWFDEEFTPAYFEDNDMHYRIKLAGKRALQAHDAAMYHKGSVTQNWNGTQVVNANMFNRNRAYYATKWGGLPGQEKYRTPFNDSKKTFKDTIR